MKKEPKPSPLPESVEEAAIRIIQKERGQPFHSEIECFKLGYQYHQTHLPESVEEPKDWTKPDENGDVDVPDYLMPLLNKLGSQLRFHTISGEGEAITLVRMTSIAEKFFKTRHSAEVERLRDTIIDKLSNYLDFAYTPEEKGFQDGIKKALVIIEEALKEK